MYCRYQGRWTTGSVQLCREIVRLNADFLLADGFEDVGTRPAYLVGRRQAVVVHRLMYVVLALSYVYPARVVVGTRPFVVVHVAAVAKHEKLQ